MIAHVASLRQHENTLQRACSLGGITVNCCDTNPNVSASLYDQQLPTDMAARHHGQTPVVLGSEPKPALISSVIFLL